MAMSKNELWPRVGLQVKEEEEVLPITLYACQWNVTKKRKENTIPFSDATFNKHVYGREKKHSLRQIEGFDPRPEEYKQTANDSLPTLLTKLRGRGLSISLSLDDKTRFWKAECSDDVTVAQLPSKKELQERVTEFKKSLELPAEKLREIELHPP